MRRLTQEEIQQMLQVPPPQRKDMCQNYGLGAWIEAECRGTIEAATGIGKTKIAIMAIVRQFRKKADSLIYVIVPTETLRDDDWPEEFKKWGYADLISKVKFVCYKSLPKTRPKKDVDLVILDEVHRLTHIAITFFKREDLNVFHVMGLTATLPKERKKDPESAERLELINSLCPSVFKVTLEEGIELELVADFEVMVLMFKLDDKHLTIPMSKKKRGKVYTVMQSEYDAYRELTKKVQMAMFNKHMAGAKFKYIGMRRQFIINLPSKKSLTKIVMNSLVKEDTKTLIFFGGIEASREICGDYVYNSETDDTYLMKFKRGEINYLGAVDALNEGKNIEGLDHGIVNQMTSVSRTIIQRFGRIVRWRPNFKARLVILAALDTVDLEWTMEALEDFDQSRITYHHVKSGL